MGTQFDGSAERSSQPYDGLQGEEVTFAYRPRSLLDVLGEWSTWPGPNGMTTST